MPVKQEKMYQCSVGMGWNETECWFKRNEQREAKGVSVFILKARSQTFACY